MPTATQNSPVVDVTVLEDGMVVRLGGALGKEATAALRAALLGPRPSTCTDVVVDAGHVTTIDDSALAVLLAAPRWADQTGARFAMAALSPALRDELSEAGLTDELVRLAPAGSRTDDRVLAAAL